MIFGSRARGNFRNGSDIDFAIWTDNHEYFYRIWGELDELPTPYKFDVIDYKVLSHEGMKNSIDKDGIIFYEKISQSRISRIIQSGLDKIKRDLKRQGIL